jgi:hypothetical protein
MSYSTGTYTGIDDAGDKFYAWALTNSWTQNYTAADGTGFRYHIEKNIGGTDFFFNLRTAINESNITDSGNFLKAGINIQGSTAFVNDAGVTDWDKQTGYTTSEYAGSDSVCGNVDSLLTSGGTYHFFATATTLSAVFESDSDELDWRIFTIGSLGGHPFYATSGGIATGTAVGVDGRSAYCSSVPSTLTDRRNAHSAVYIDTEGWYVSRLETSGSTFTRIVGNLVSPNVSADNIALRGSVTASTVEFSPDSFRGNAQLAPSSMNITKGLTNEYWPVSDVEGVKFINVTNYSNEQEIIYDGDTYMLFHIYNPSPTGVAFLK